MSESSSDTDSSGGWTIISKEGFDVETLDGAVGGENQRDSPPMMQKIHDEGVAAGADSTPQVCQPKNALDVTVPSAQGQGSVEEDEATVSCSRSNDLDVATLERSGLAGHQQWERPEGSKEVWTEPDISATAPLPGDSSSSESESAGQLPSRAVRTRRIKTGGTMRSGEARGSAPGQKKEEGQVEWESHIVSRTQDRVIGAVNICISLAVILVISMGLSHIYDGTAHFQQKPKVVETVPVEDLSDVREDLHWSQEEGDVIAMSKSKNEDLQSKQTAEGRQRAESSHQEHLSVENRQLKSLLVCEEKSVFTLQEELRNLRTQIRNLERKGVGSDSVLPEKHRYMRSFFGLREVLIAEAQVLHGELDRERRVTDLLKEELGQLRGHFKGPWGTSDLETELFQARLMELEKKLNFEQRRSDLWWRLYVQDMDKRARGDKWPRIKLPKGGRAEKVKDTFHAVKNISILLEHHDKEDVKREKEAVKENLRKFFDSAMSAFYNFKEMAQSFLGTNEFLGRGRSFERKDDNGKYCKQSQVCLGGHSGGASWPQKHRQLQRTSDSFQADSETLMPGIRVHVYPEGPAHTGTSKGCSGVSDCATQEFTSLFNRALNPIRLSEFSQLIYTYLQHEVDHFHHWEELESFINGFFYNGVFIHDQMLFTDFVSGIEDYLKDRDEYKCLNKDVFEDLDKYVYGYFFGDAFSQGCSQR